MPRTWTFGDGHGSSKVSDQQVGVVYTNSSAAPIISLSNSGALNYIDPSSSDPIRVVQGHKGSIETICIKETTGAKTIFTGSYDGRVCAWDVPTGDPKVVAEEDAKIAHLTPVSDGVLFSVHKKEDEIKRAGLGDIAAKYCI